MKRTSDSYSQANVHKNEYSCFGKETNRVLLFPPFSSHCRFLIHKLIEEYFPEMESCSVGQGSGRRTVVGSKNMKISGSDSSNRIIQDDSQLSFSTPSDNDTSPIAKKKNKVPPIKLYKPPAARVRATKDYEEVVCDIKEPVKPQVGDEEENSKDASSLKKMKAKRPDLKVYIPRAKRHTELSVDCENERNIKSVSNNIESHFRISKTISASQNNLEFLTKSEKQNPSRKKKRIKGKLNSSTSCDNVSQLIKNEPSTSPDAYKETDHLETIPNDNFSHLKESHTNSKSFNSSQFCAIKTDGNSTINNNPSNNVESSVVNCGVHNSEVSLNHLSVISNGDPVVDSDVKTTCDSLVSGSEVEEYDVMLDHLLNVSIGSNEVCEYTVSSLIKPSVNDLVPVSDSSVKNIKIDSEQLDLLIEDNKQCDQKFATSTPHVLKHAKELIEHKKILNKSQLNESEAQFLGNTKDSWEAMYDESGDCVQPDILKEITQAIGNVEIYEPINRYDAYLQKDLLDGDDRFGHVIEIYNFPQEFKTEDLLSVFSDFRTRGFNIKWVDDTHALGVFSSPLVAADALSLNHPIIKTRPLSMATRESKAKARKTAEFLQPYKARPETSAVLARRLVSGALGLRVTLSKEQREAEKQKLNDAKEKRRRDKKLREEAWEGNFQS